MNPKRIVRILFITVVLAGSGLFALKIYWGINGNPWTKSEVAKEIVEYASKKYGKEMVLERATFDMKDGSYGAYIHAENEPSFRIGIVKRRISPTDYSYIEYRQ